MVSSTEPAQEDRKNKVARATHNIITINNNVAAAVAAAATGGLTHKG
jgi:hypothetical protein